MESHQKSKPVTVNLQRLQQGQMLSLLDHRTSMSVGSNYETQPKPRGGDSL